MSEALQIPAEETPAKPEIDTKYEIARVIEARAVQGYKVESLSDTRAVLVINGRKRLFGLRGGVPQRSEVTVNAEGRAVTRNL
jgi:hypothetical protein